MRQLSIGVRFVISSLLFLFPIGLLTFYLWKAHQTLPKEFHDRAYGEFATIGIVLSVTGLLVIYIGFSIANSLKVFQGAVQNLKEDSQQALKIGGVLMQASKRVSDSSSAQAAAVEETSASLEEISSIVKINADSSQKAQVLTLEARQQAETGLQDMLSLIQKMGEISDGSKKIEEIMLLIDDVAFQTNLLALNASVEAARAGEHGKGFAVVADAVRALAQKSAESAKQIETLIKTSLIQIEEGRLSADRTGESMKAIQTTIVNVNQINTEIAQASREQAVGIDQISKAIHEIERTVMQSSEVSSQASEYSQKSLSQAEGLMRLVDVLEAGLNGKSHANSVKSQASVEISFDQAIAAHLQWKGRLKNYIQGLSDEKFSSAIVCKDNNCALGKWIHGPGVGYKSLESYSRLKKEHAEFHEAAGEVIKAVEQNQREKASVLLKDDSNFDIKTKATVTAIQDLQQDIERG